MWLLFGNRCEKDIDYHGEFLRLRNLDSNFHYLPTLRRADDNRQDLRGYVQQHAPALAEGRSDMHAYICGWEKMVKANRELLKSLGWDRTSIRYEKYD
jgi:NAD(P)H-flavin reductase